MWTQLRGETLAVFREAPTNRAVRENAYDMLDSFCTRLSEGRHSQETPAIMNLISQKDILDAIWSAATAARLTPRATARLAHSAVPRLETSGGTVQLPPWWDENLEALRVSLQPPQGPSVGSA